MVIWLENLRKVRHRTFQLRLLRAATMARRLSKQKTREKAAEDASDEGTRYTADPRSTGLRWDATRRVPRGLGVVRVVLRPT